MNHKNQNNKILMITASILVIFLSSIYNIVIKTEIEYVFFSPKFSEMHLTTFLKQWLFCHDTETIFSQLSSNYEKFSS